MQKGIHAWKTRLSKVFSPLENGTLGPQVPDRGRQRSNSLGAEQNGEAREKAEGAPLRSKPPMWLFFVILLTENRYSAGFVKGVYTWMKSCISEMKR